MEKHFHRGVAAWVVVDLVQKMPPSPAHIICTALGVGVVVVLLIVFEKRTNFFRWCWRKVCNR